MAYSAFSGLNAGNAGIKRTIRQTNSFVVGDVVRLDAGSYVKAQADSSVNAEIVGVVESRSESNFTVVFAGEVNLENTEHEAVTMGKVYFLSSSVAGKYTPDAPLSTGTIKKTVFIGAENNKGIIVNYLGLVNGYEGGDTVSLTGVSPVGQIIPFAGAISTPQQVPNGWLLCNGGEFSQLDYPELATLLGDTYGQRNGNIFKLPDLRGRSPIGVNQTTSVMDANEILSLRVLGTRDGTEFAELGNQHMPNHSHGASYLAFKDDAGEDGGEGRQSDAPTPGFYYGPNATDETSTSPSGTYQQISTQGPILTNDWQFWAYGEDDHNYGLVHIPSTVEPSGGGEGHNNMQPFLVTNWLIRADSRVSASILTVNLQDLADVNSNESTTAKNGGVPMWTAANNFTGTEDAEDGDNRFIINPLYDSERNALINGNFDVWQRGTDFTHGSAIWRYTADRWFHSQSSSYGADGTITRMDQIDANNHPFLQGSGLSPITSVPGTHALVYRNSDSKSSFSAENYNCMGQLIEGFDYAPLYSAGYMTLSFWVYARFAGIYNMSFRNHSYDRCYVAEYTVNNANTWEHKTMTIPIDTEMPNKWKFNSEVGLRVEWQIGKQGANYTTTATNPANQWNNTSTKGTPNAVNCLATPSGSSPCLAIAQCQLEPGRVATQFQTRRIEDEIAKCQRYYQKSYNLGVVPGTVTNGGRRHADDWVISNTAHFHMPFYQRMRTTPAVSIYNPINGAINSFNMTHKASGSHSTHSVVAVNRSETAITEITRSGSSTLNASYKNKIMFHYTATSELGPDGGGVSNVT